MGVIETAKRALDQVRKPRAVITEHEEMLEAFGDIANAYDGTGEDTFGAIADATTPEDINALEQAERAANETSKQKDARRTRKQIRTEHVSARARPEVKALLMQLAEEVKGNKAKANVADGLDALYERFMELSENAQ